MNALVLNGFFRPGAFQEEEIYLVNKLSSLGFKVEKVKLSEQKIQHCVGCFGCWFVTPGECVQNDYAREIMKKMCQAELLVLLSPITFGGYSSCLKKALDKILQLLLPHIVLVKGICRHRNRYGQGPDILAVGVSDCSNQGEAEIFKKMVAKNAFNLSSKRSTSVVLEMNEKDVNAENLFDEALRQIGQWHDQ